MKKQFKITLDLNSQHPDTASLHHLMQTKKIANIVIAQTPSQRSHIIAPQNEANLSQRMIVKRVP
jgi:hypothetical protein